jgi:hypothetical protein
MKVFIKVNIKTSSPHPSSPLATPGQVRLRLWLRRDRENTPVKWEAKTFYGTGEENEESGIEFLKNYPLIHPKLRYSGPRTYIFR